MKKVILLSALVFALAPGAHAILYTTNFTGGFLVPDSNPNGVADARNVTTMPAGTLQSVAVTLNITGGWNGDLYAYLVHGTGFSMLLDRVGPGTYGYNDAGMNVILADPGSPTTLGTASTRSIALYQTFTGPGAPTGIWNPDNTSGNLASFLPTTPNGTWTLFLADLSGGSVSTVQSWGLQMDIVAVPEVETWVAAALAGMFGAFWLNRQIFGGRQAPPMS